MTTITQLINSFFEVIMTHTHYFVIPQPLKGFSSIVSLLR